MNASPLLDLPGAVAGNGIDATKRRAGTEWYHSVQDAGALVRDFVKWDDQPGSLQHFAESAVRAYRVATTPPMEPVLLMADIELQEDPVEHGDALSIPKLTPPRFPQGDAGALDAQDPSTRALISKYLELRD